MTADERIELLLNRFGETVEDLPKPTRTDYAYEFSHQNRAVLTAIDWCKKWNDNEAVLADYICHLTDVIDQMEKALNNALFALMDAACGHCATYTYKWPCKECYEDFVLLDAFYEEDGGQE